MELELIVKGIRLHVGRQKNMVCDDSGRKIATTFGANKEEYAKLIAAAPELLEALQNIVWQFETNIHGYENHPSYQQARNAINKALNGK